MKSVVYLSGLPRTGSTVLSSLLNQHPRIHATTTSPVADLVSMALDNWGRLSGALVNPHPGQLGGILDGIISGAHQHVREDVVVDKNRLWPRYAEHLYRATGIKPKIICTVRPIPEIMASYILLIHKNSGRITFIDAAVAEAGLPVNNKTRCKILLENFINHPYTSLKIGYNSRAADMCFVHYRDLVEDSSATMQKIYSFIGVEDHSADTANLQDMEENDVFHGGIQGLHHVRPQLARTSPQATEVLGVDLAEYYSKMRLEFWQK